MQILRRIGPTIPKPLGLSFPENAWVPGGGTAPLYFSDRLRLLALQSPNSAPNPQTNFFLTYGRLNALYA